MPKYIITIYHDGLPISTFTCEDRCSLSDDYLHRMAKKWWMDNVAETIWNQSRLYSDGREVKGYEK